MNKCAVFLVNFFVINTISNKVFAIQNSSDVVAPPTFIGFKQDDNPIENDECFHLIRNENGFCSAPEKCIEAIRDFQNGIQPQICSYINNHPIVCCPQGNAIHTTTTHRSTVFDYSPTSGGRISARKCEEYSKLGVERIIVGALSVDERMNNTVEKPKCALNGGGGFIVGGTVTKAGEFPHMAAIGWRKENDEIEFKCGGSLISYQFVLSAAHCTSAHNKRPSFIRLGEQNINSDDDGANTQDIEIAAISKHQDYRPSSKYNDLALFKLERKVFMADNVRPACLWQSHQIEYSSAIATGWGLTRDRGHPSDELLKVSLKLIDNQYCDGLFKPFKSSTLKHGIIESQLCAGDDMNERDTCSGDSGGPLHVQTPQYACIYHLIGVTSFGVGCGNGYGVYTRVSSYLDWIENEVWNDYD